jgi:hypothetical protein
VHLLLLRPRQQQAQQQLLRLRGCPVLPCVLTSSGPLLVLLLLHLQLLGPA